MKPRTQLLQATRAVRANPRTTGVQQTLRSTSRERDQRKEGPRRKEFVRKEKQRIPDMMENVGQGRRGGKLKP